MQEAMGLLGEKVYITFDLDAFDPSIMPATGTPEPGGLLWNPVLKFLKMVFRQRDVLGFDIVELAPDYDHSVVSTATATTLIRELFLLLSQ